MSAKKSLIIIMPVYNEEAAIGSVLEKWTEKLDTMFFDNGYQIHVYNDGSRDRTGEILADIEEKYSGKVIAHNKPNSGHGPTILQGYRENAPLAEWLFQIDSDDEMGPEKFSELWEKREKYDFLVGTRDGRKQALPRKIISFVSRLCIRLFYGKSIWDVNTPYRLMRTSAFEEIWESIPQNTFAPNVIISGMAGCKKLRSCEICVPQRDRQTGEVSIKKWKLFKAAVKSFVQTIFFSLRTLPLRKKIIPAIFIVLLLAAFLSICIGIKNGMKFIDFQYIPAKIMINGENPYLYSFENRTFESLHVEANQVPSCLLLLAPYTFFPRMTANFLWLISNLIFTCIFLIVLYRLYLERLLDNHGFDSFFFLIVCLLFLAGTPWRTLIGNGQHLMFSMCFFILAFYYSRKTHDFLSGILLALSLFKYTTIFPLCFIFLFCKKWKPLAIAAFLHLSANILLGLYLNESPVVLLLQSLQTGNRLIGQGCCDPASLLTAFGCSLKTIHIGAICGYVSFGSLLAAVTFSGKKNILLKLSIMALVANLMFYHRIYDFILLIFPLIYVFDIPENASRTRNLLKIVSVANVFFFFFRYNFLDRFIQISSPVFCFILQFVLLILLLTENWNDADNSRLACPK